MMTWNKFLTCAMSGISCLPGYGNTLQNTKSGERPNVLMVVVDDMGFSDLQPFGGEISTPNINALASNGTCFTRFHTSSLSAPTRAMLLTGVDNHQNGLGVMPAIHAENQYMQPGYEGYLNERVMTIAEILQQNGYYTCMTGKWHLGAQQGHTPNERGFEKSFTMLGGGASHFSLFFALGDEEKPVTFYMENGKRIDTLPDDFYSTTYYTDKMIGYLQDCPTNKPFFAYLAYTAPHDPLHIPQEWADKYKGKYDAGYDSIRVQRTERQRKLGIIPTEIPINDACGAFPAWDDLSEEEKKEQSRKMEIYAAMIEYVDYNIGRIINELKRENKLDNTLIIFLSDNGANPKEPTFYAGNTPEVMEQRYDNSYDNYGNPNSFISLGGGWAEVSDTPYSYFKMTTAEGGICTPLIISGNCIKKKGMDTQNLLHVTDLVPTILDYTHTERPISFHGVLLAPLYGKSLWGLLNGNLTQPLRGENESICFEMKEDKAIIKGDWKALLLSPPYGDGKTWKLYNLRKDPIEKNDVADIYPQKLQELVDEWERYADSVGYIRARGEQMIKLLGADKFYEYQKHK